MMATPDRRPSGSRPILAPTSPSRHADSISGSPSRAALTARLATPIAASPTAGEAEHTPDRPPRSPSPLAGASANSLPGPGTSSLSQALRGGPSHSPQRSGTPPTQPGAGNGKRGVDSPDRRDQRRGRGSFTPNSTAAGQLGRSPKATEDLEVLKRHLVNHGQPGSEPASYKRASPFPHSLGAPADEDDFSSLQLQGGDTTRHIYRYAEKREREETGRLQRSSSVHLPGVEHDDREISNIQMPGGFRREHIRRTAVSPAPSSVHRRGQDYGTLPGVPGEPPRAAPQFVTSNFIEFLTLYGHFAGETLDEDDEVLEPDEYFSSDAFEEATDGDDRGDDDRGWGEDSALLTPGKRKRKRKSHKSGSGSTTGAALLLLKSFVGTGVLFLPRAFLNGGMLFSNLVLLFIAIVSYYCFLLLVATRLKVHASFGDMGGYIYGKHFRNMINTSLVISQIGFSSAYIVFVGANLQAFILAVSKCRTDIDIKWVILMQMIIFLPLSLYRNINHIQKLALIADVFILLGLIYLYFYGIKTLVDQGGVSDIKAFNPKDWTLFIGTAIFTFEGIGLIIPIQSGMKDPGRFPRVLAIVMVIISVVFISMGALSYAAYGSHTRTVIILNMPQDNKLVNGVQFIYSLAILLSTPLQIYPAIEITSQQLFSRTGKYNPWIKWQKNVFRFFMVILCALIAWLGANNLDKFVALVGSFACVPLVYIYPVSFASIRGQPESFANQLPLQPLMHYRVAATQRWQKVLDIILVVFGVCVMVYTTALTVDSWIRGSVVSEPGYCDGK